MLTDKDKRQIKRNKKYWQKRDQEQKAWIQQNLNSDAKMIDELHKVYNASLQDINQQIELELAKSDDHSLFKSSLKPVNDADYRSFLDKANFILHTLAHNVRSDTYKMAKQRINLYKLTAPYSRLELLRAGISTALANGTAIADQALYDHLISDYESEYDHSAQIVNLYLKSKLDPRIVKVIMTQTKGANFSQRLWGSGDALAAELGTIISNSEISGQSYKKTAKQLRKKIGQAFDATASDYERLIRTESARCETQATINLAHDKGLDYFKWYAEPSACKICSDIASNDEEGKGEGIYLEKDLPTLPEHPNCRCSIAPYWVDD